MTDGADSPAVTADELVARADAFRPRLLEEQAATEERSYYSEELHAAFTDAGFYRMLVPRRYGGLELDLPTFYRVMTSISRGCPSTGWMLALGSAHALQAASYFSGGGAGRDLHRRRRALPRLGELRVPGRAGRSPSTAAIASAAPGTSAPACRTRRITCRSCRRGDGDEKIVAVVPREKFQMLDNWGDLIGLKGSGSHSVVIEDVLVPAHHTITLDEWLAIGVTSTPGYRLHGNPLYGGSFMAVALGELNSVQVGNAQAAVDEYERMLGKPTRQAAAAEGRERSRRPELPAGARARARLHGRRRTRSCCAAASSTTSTRARRWRAASRSARSGRSGSTGS